RAGCVAGLIDAIPIGATVGIDTPIFIYQFEASPTYQPLVGPFFQALSRGQFRGVTSVVTLMEVAVLPLRLEHPEVANEYELLLLPFANLAVVGVDRVIARRAAELRARLRLPPADSLQVATALERGAELMLTNDRGMARSSELNVLVLDDFRA